MMTGAQAGPAAQLPLPAAMAGRRQRRHRSVCRQLQRQRQRRRLRRRLRGRTSGAGGTKAPPRPPTCPQPPRRRRTTGASGDRQLVSITGLLLLMKTLPSPAPLILWLLVIVFSSSIKKFLLRSARRGDCAAAVYSAATAAWNSLPAVFEPLVQTAGELVVRVFDQRAPCLLGSCQTLHPQLLRRAYPCNTGSCSLRAAGRSAGGIGVVAAAGGLSSGSSSGSSTKSCWRLGRRT